MKPSKKIIELRGEMSRPKFAQKFGVATHTIKFINELALVLEKEYNIPFKWWKTGEGPVSIQAEIPTKINTGERLKLIRNKTGLSQSKFAEELEVKTHTIKHLEAETQKLSLEFAQKISKKYNIDFMWLMTGEGEPETTPEKRIEKLQNYKEEPKKDLEMDDSEINNFVDLATSKEYRKNKELFDTLLKARKGDKEALAELKGMIKILEANIE